MDLLNPYLWTSDMPYGNTSTDGIGVVHPYMTDWEVTNNKMLAIFSVKKELTQGWYMDKNWIKQTVDRHYQYGHVITDNTYYFGIYKIVCSLPNFKGAWPSVWFFSKDKGPPPEVDVFEHFRKDKCLTRHKITCTYHPGPTYENQQIVIKTRRSLRKFDKHPLYLEFHWHSDHMIWVVNNKRVLTVYRKDVAKFPYYPMNILMGTGIKDWNGIEDTFRSEPFIVSKFEYFPSES